MEYFLQIASNALILAALYSILALGFNLIYSTNKFFDISYAAYIVIGAYAYLSLKGLGLNTPLTFILALILPVLTAALLEKLLYSKLRVKHSSGAVMMIASLGVLTVAQAIIALIFTSNVQTLASSSDTFSFSAITVTGVQLAILLIAVVAHAITLYFLSKTSLGVQLRALSDNEELAITSQLPVYKLRMMSTLAGALLGATAAILYGMDTSIDPYMGMQLLLKGTVVAIISGLGGIAYGVIGAIVLAILETGTVWYIGGEWKDAVAFLVLIVILLWRPTGILRK